MAGVWARSSAPSQAFLDLGGLVPIVVSSRLHGCERRCSSSCWMA